jgi:mono/diheme cytochrome c family protein
MKKWLLAVLFIAVLALAACGGGGDDDGATEDPADTDNGTEESADNGADDGGSVDTAAGEDVYQQNCAMCHGADLSGGAGPDLTTAGSSFSAEELEDIIVNGTGSMPAQDVSGDDLDALVGWLSEQQ